MTDTLPFLGYSSYTTTFSSILIILALFSSYQYVFHCFIFLVNASR